MSFVGKEREGSACGKATKGTAKGEAGAPCKGKSTAKGEEVEESREKSGMPYEGKGAARGVEKKFIEDVEKEG